MAGYADYEYYKSIYGETALTAEAFNRLSWDAFRAMDANTTGIDGFKKLKHAFPVAEDDAEAVRRCACNLIDIMYQTEQAETTAASSHGYVKKEDGTVVGKVVSSVSSGSESISYSSGSGASMTVYEQAAFDLDFRNKLLIDTVRKYLSGIPDANGVNLLYMGRYPGV